MELTQKDISKISNAINKALKDRRMNASALAKKTDIHKTQISKFKRGLFKRYSSKLQQVCNELQIDIIQSPLPELQINRAINDIWDGTTQHADKITKLIREIGPMLS